MSCGLMSSCVCHRLTLYICPGYHKNALMSLLEDAGYAKLHTIYRLDRLTSGLMILAKSSAVAAQWGKAIKDRTGCEKLYLARVAGRFPNHLRKSGLSLLEPREPTPSSRQMQGQINRDIPLQQQSCLPYYGEWQTVVQGGQQNERAAEVDTAKGSKETQDPRERVQQLRQIYAHGFWISRRQGSCCSSDESLLQNDRFATLAEMENQHVQTEIQLWLENRLENAGHQELLSKLHWLHLACPVRIEQPKNGVCKYGTFNELDDATYLRTVKPAHTSFAFLGYDAASDSSLVLCRPWTGRSHQIRLHLQCLGHSIANDPNYGGTTWFGNPEGQAMADKAKAQLQAMDEVHQQAMGASDTCTAIEEVETTDPPCCPVVDTVDSLTAKRNGNNDAVITVLNSSNVPATQQEINHLLSAAGDRQSEESLEAFVRRSCVWCARAQGDSQPQQQQRALLEFLVRSPGIWLHALQYRVGGLVSSSSKDDEEKKVHTYCFRTQAPQWSLQVLHAQSGTSTTQTT